MEAKAESDFSKLIREPARKGGAAAWQRCGDPIIDAWNMAGGMNWGAFPFVFAALGITDAEGAVQELIAIREFQRKESEEPDAGSSFG